MRIRNQDGFSAFEIVIVVVIVGLIGTVGWLVMDRNKSSKNNAAANGSAQSASSNTPKKDSSSTAKSTQKYLTIKEWGVKVPLTDVTKNATYRINKGNVFFDVAIEGDTNKDCIGQAAMSKVRVEEAATTEPPTSKADLVRLTSKIGNYFYMIQGTQASCSENDSVQTKASAIRAEFLNQNKAVIAE